MFKFDFERVAHLNQIYVMGDTYIVQFIQEHTALTIGAIISGLAAIVAIIANSWNRIEKICNNIRYRKQAPIDWIDGIRRISQTLCEAINSDVLIAILKDVESLRKDHISYHVSPYSRIVTIKREVNKCFVALDNQIRMKRKDYPQEYIALANDYITNIKGLKERLDVYFKDIEFIADKSEREDVEVRSSIELSHHPDVDPSHWNLPCSEQLKLMCAAALEDKSTDIVLNLVGLYFGNGQIPRFDAEIETYTRNLDGAIRVAELGRVSASEIDLVAGSPMSQYNIAIWYKNKNDNKNAAIWCCKAAKGGYDEAQFEYGAMCEEGLGVSKSPELALYWYNEAAKQNHSKALLRAGILYKQRGKEGDLDNAKKYLCQAESAGVVEAAKYLHMLFYHTKEWDDMFTWGWASLKLGLINYRDLAWFYLLGPEEIRDTKKGVDLAMQGISAGETACYVFLGQWYESENRYEEAVGLYMLGASIGDVHSHEALGRCYLIGNPPYPCEANFTESYKHLKAAAEAGRIEAQSMLGMLLIQGNGVESFKEEGVALLMNAFEKGSSNAPVTLGTLMDIYQQPAAAYRFFVEAAHRNRSDVLPKIADYCEQGIGVDSVDIDVAKEVRSLYDNLKITIPTRERELYSILSQDLYERLKAKVVSLGIDNWG